MNNKQDDIVSLDFEKEKQAFRKFYEEHKVVLEGARDFFAGLLSSLLSYSTAVTVAKVEGRVKDREECIRKFKLKYLAACEEGNTPYVIADHITDLIGLRIVCLYEDEIDKIKEILCQHLEVVDIVDKTAQIEKTEASFGYKGVHLDVRLGKKCSELPEYKKFASFGFEVQIRTIIQDSWSVLDHKIKYKKSIPNHLKRRINSLAALFEVADREFREIRDFTQAEMMEEAQFQDKGSEDATGEVRQDHEKGRFRRLNAFSFLKIANHFFKDYEFDPYKVDGFTQEVLDLKPDTSRAFFDVCMRDNIAIVKKYKADFEEHKPQEKLSVFTMIRHCLYLGDKRVFADILSRVARKNFDAWLLAHLATQVSEHPVD